MWTSSLSRYPETHDSTLSYTFLFLWFFSWKVLNLYPRTTNDNVSVSPSYGHGILHAIYCFSSVLWRKRGSVFLMTNILYFYFLYLLSYQILLQHDLLIFPKRSLFSALLEPHDLLCLPQSIENGAITFYGLIIKE